jgi:serine phosphatase RsbU (regulator of sigma subunit)
VEFISINLLNHNCGVEPSLALWMSTGTRLNCLAQMKVSREIEAQRRAIAERVESERRTEQELEIAKQVQARLFPQSVPPLRTLDYAGVCIQARHVGGDYYDFLALGPNRVGLLIGDISGKGIAAALLMANLQANLCSQFALAREQPQLFLRSVNQPFYENTVESAYATIFFADYDDRTLKLRYADCGHLSALLLRQDDTLEQLHSTGTVLGLFRDWEGPTVESQLCFGDTLALYTDGVTEACNEQGEEFGEKRLAVALRRHRKLNAQSRVAAILEEVQRFTGC